MNEYEILNWLRRFGYHQLLGVHGFEVAIASDFGIRCMVRSAQSFLGLVEDGDPGPKTMAAMQRPRCGCPDHLRMPSARVPAFGAECRLEVGVYADWTGIKGISHAHAYNVMADSFRMLESYNLRMKTVDDPNDALIGIGMGLADPGVLAWMTVGDGCGWLHRSLFNIDVNWSDDLLFAGTFVHEVVGHGAGVGHSASIGSIMDPSYDPNVPNIIDPWFGSQLEKRYGLSSGTVPTPDPPTTNPPGVPGMPWAEIITIVLPLIIECIQGGADDTSIEGALRSPNSRELRRMRRGVKRHVRRTEPSMRRQDRKVRVDALLDSIVTRALEATDQEVADVIREAHVLEAA